MAQLPVEMISVPDTSTIPTEAGTQAASIPSIRRLMWLRFKRNRLAVIGGVFLITMYAAAIFADPLAPYGVNTTHDRFVSTPPNGLRFVDDEGNFHLQPFVYGMEPAIDRQTFRKTFKLKTDEQYPIRFFGRGEPYQLWGLFTTDIHLITVDAPGKIFLLGTDELGRDLFSRVLFGARISLSVGLVGVFLTLIFGSLVGVTTGYFGGWIDALFQRLIEVLMAFPQLPLWLGLASIVPPT